jgi:hypothetical protein
MISTYVRISEKTTVRAQIPADKASHKPYIDLTMFVDNRYAGTVTVMVDRLEDAQALVNAAQQILDYFDAQAKQAEPTPTTDTAIVLSL